MSDFRSIKTCRVRQLVFCRRSDVSFKARATRDEMAFDGHGLDYPPPKAARVQTAAQPAAL